MEKYTFEIAEDKTYPNITVYRKMKDGVQSAWRINADEGYVFFDTTADATIVDPETGEETVEICYSKAASLPLNYDFANFPYAAVLEEIVNEGD